MRVAPDPEDLTARARIRDAAMAHFAEHGFERATIRGIAETAGVSSGLLRHHFGSKRELREACDEYLVRLVRRLNDEVDVASGVNHLAEARRAIGPYERYLARSLSEGAAATVFDEMVARSEEWIERYDHGRVYPRGVDPRGRAAVMTAMALAVPLLLPHVARHLGVDPHTPAGDDKLARTVIDVYAHPWMSAEDAETVRAGLDRLAERGEPR